MGPEGVGEGAGPEGPLGPEGPAGVGGADGLVPVVKDCIPTTL